VRPHALRLTAFGPFAETVEVDLDALAAAGLFLLHGQTGAGKTTLLDGIGFALFGRVPGVRNGAKRLRSDHAAASLRPEVQLEATLVGRRMRITRSPSWERAKARGTGTTTEQARVQLEELVDGSWRTLSTRPREADDEIADLVGMSAEQFFQVVLLPQGDFAQFLRASSAERAEVLKKLFATERFADVEGWLVNRRRVTAEQVAAARGSLARVVARVAEVAGVAGDEVPTQDELPWAVELLGQAAAAEQQAALRVDEATAVRDDRRSLAEAAVRLAGLQQRRATALARQQQLEAELPARLALQAEVDAAGRAAEVAGALGAVGDRRRLRETALGAEVTARTALVDVGVEAALDVDGLRSTVAAARQRSGRLEALRAVDELRRAAVDQAAQAQDEQADALAQVATLELQLAVLPARRQEAASLLASARAAAEQVPSLRAERDRLARLRPDVVQLGLVTSRVQALSEETLSAREAALALEVKAHDLRVASVNSMIARLAFRLESGVPCDVCGSLEHPDPSALRDEGVSSDDEDRARRDAEQAQEVVARLQEQLAAERATAAGLQGRVGSLTLAGVDAELAAADLELDVLEAAVTRLADAEAGVLDLDRQRAEAMNAQVAATTRAEAAARRAAEATARAEAAQRQLVAALGPDTGLVEALDRVAALVVAAEQAATAAEALAAAQGELDRAVVAAESACVSAGFASTGDAFAASRSSEWRAASLARLREVADVAATVAAELTDPSLDVPLEPPAPVRETAAVLAEADRLLVAASEVLGERRQRRTALERLAPELRAELAALEPLEQRAREVRALADLCAGSGANGLKMTLTSFVLAARLEEVAEAASVRLLKMTQGRYTLVHTDGAARGGVRSGLGLLARDGWSGQDRDTSTLSGGETFLASLALALGLADVVAAEAGGSRIGALFVDEGFGTLDEDTLDEVMDVLDGLREGGRVVGVVSHVAELRQRIPAQVLVTRTRSGSAVRVLGC
jgi:exonuclease SbcC